MTSTAASPLSIFISYSHRDEDYKDDLVVHLSTLQRQGKIRAWQDRDIEAGAEWDAEIKQQLESAEIILLLITPRFLASDYCYDLEMQRAVQRHEEGTARVIPIIVKPCDWQGTPFSKLQVVPKDAKPITKWDDQDDAFLNVVQSIRKAVESLQAKKSIGATTNNLPVVALTPSPIQFSTYNPTTFAGREAETAHLTTLLSSNCRVLAIVGMTGIGKTALAERVVAHLMQTPETATLPYYRFSLDDRSLTPDFFSSGAALLRTLGEEPTLADQQDPANLLAHLLNHLQSQPCRVQIDSLERLLRGNEQDGWSEFCDPLWLDLLQQFLAATNSPSQLLLTSQDIPADLDTVASRYPQFWHYEPLQSLNPDAQRTLFQKLGLNPSDTDWELLDRIGAFYDGHPLVLQVIAEELRQPPFRGNIARYWQHYEAEFTTVSNVSGNKLDRSRLFRRRVRQRVEQSIQFLPEAARQLLCACSVFRRPVPEDFWYTMLPEGDAQTAFDTLLERNLINYAAESDTLPLIRQHNLIRSVASSLLKADPAAWESAERQAAHLWLTAYEPAPNAPNLEMVRGYLEAFEHYCEIGDWDAASEIYKHQLPSINQKLYWQLFMWGYYQESLEMSHKLVDKVSSQVKSRCLNQIGNAYTHLGKIEKAIAYYRQALEFCCETFDRRGEGVSLNCLGNAYYYLGHYEQAIDHYQQALTIAREVGDRYGEGTYLVNIGNVYSSLGQYEQAFDHYQQALTIAREVDDRRGESVALGNQGIAYYYLGQYEQALDHYLQALTIAREIGDREAESNSLVSLGLTYDNLGQYERAIDHCQQALIITQEIGNRHGEGSALCSLGDIQLKLEQYSESLSNIQAALEIFQEIGAKSGETEALQNLAEVYQVLGEVEVARQYAQQALALATELGIPLKAECEALLVTLEQGEN